MSYRVLFRLAALAAAACVAATFDDVKAAAAPFTPTAASLARLAAPAESFHVGILKVDRYGDHGKPLILIPGLAGGPWVWSGTIATMAKDHVIYAVTLADSTVPRRPPRKAIGSTRPTRRWRPSCVRRTCRKGSSSVIASAARSRSISQAGIRTSPPASSLSTGCRSSPAWTG